MKKKFFDDILGNRVYHWNTLETIKLEEDNSFDLVLSDPPYNIWYKNNRRIKTRDKIHWVDWIANDIDNLDMIKTVYQEYFRILKEGCHIYIFSRWDVNQDHINLLKDAWFIVKNTLIWMKNSWSMGDLEGDYAWQYETIIFWYKPFSSWTRKGKGNKLNQILDIKRHPNILKYDRIVGKKQIHSHQKPIDLLQFLIKKSSKAGDKVYDGFIGSNSLWQACLTLNRHYTWTELDPNNEIFPAMQKITIELAELIQDYMYNKKENPLYLENFHIFLLPKTYSFKKDIVIKRKDEKITLSKKSIDKLYTKEDIWESFMYNIA